MLVCKTLENFFASADEELTIDHVPIWCKNSHGQRVMVEQSEKLVSFRCTHKEGPGVIALFHFLSTTSTSRTGVGESSVCHDNWESRGICFYEEYSQASISLNSHNARWVFVCLFIFGKGSLCPRLTSNSRLSCVSSCPSLCSDYRQVHIVSCTLVFPLSCRTDVKGLAQRL